MEAFSALLAIRAGNSPVSGEFPAQRPVTRSFDIFFDLRLNKRLSKQSWGWWFETLSHPLWCQCNDKKYQSRVIGPFFYYLFIYLFIYLILFIFFFWGGGLWWPVYFAQSASSTESVSTTWWRHGYCKLHLINDSNFTVTFTPRHDTWRGLLLYWSIISLKNTCITCICDGTLLTLYVLNFAEGTLTYICILCHYYW